MDIQALVSQALPGEPITRITQATPDRWTVQVAGGDRYSLTLFESVQSGETALAALDYLRAEVDLPVPVVRAKGFDDRQSVFCILSSEIVGSPIYDVWDRVPAASRYQIGVKLGQTIHRIHQISVGGFGGLRSPSVNRDERSYVLARLADELERATSAALLDQGLAERIHHWFGAEFQPASRGPLLIHADLSPLTVLVAPGSGGWRLSAITGWEYAQGWAPIWEHTTLFDAFYHPDYFDLRVGYGNGYDDEAQRAYEQVREVAMLPYRVLLALRNLSDSQLYGDVAAQERYHQMVETTFALLG